MAPLLSCLLLAATAPAAFAVPVNDDFLDRLPLQLDVASTRSNVGASIESDEGLTANDPNGDGCSPTGDAGPAGTQMDGTLWWDVVGNGGPLTISTVGSDFDTVLAVYDTTADETVACNDDIQPGVGAGLASEVLLQSIAGRHYAVQVGGCATSPDGCNPTTSGAVTLRASSTPPNDDRADATPISAGSPISSTNKGATLESGEVTSCVASTGAASPFAKTVWFRWHAPATGRAVFTASGFDTVLDVYRGVDRSPLGCNDDAIGKQSGGSSLPMTQPAGPPVTVTPGDYLIQVGGFYDPSAFPVAARDGQLTVEVQFTGDVVAVAVAVAVDGDGDGVAQPQDCDDDNPRVHPGARDVPENGIDEDCDGSDASLRRLRARIAVSHYGRDGLVVIPAIPLSNVPAHTRIELRCRARGCPFRHRTFRTGRRRFARLDALTRLRLGPEPLLKLHPTARIEIRATHARRVGVSAVYVFRSQGGPTITQTCLGPFGPVSC